jgi:hypothetical protein
MRKTVKTAKPITLTIPVWHDKPQKTFDKLPYNQAMVRLELPAGEYSREYLDSMVMRGASAEDNVITYLASCGYVPGMLDGEITDITTGQDPETELN